MKEKVAFCEKCGEHFIVKEEEGKEVERTITTVKMFIHKNHTCPICNASNMVLWLHWLDGRGER